MLKEICAIIIEAVLVVTFQRSGPKPARRENGNSGKPLR